MICEKCRGEGQRSTVEIGPSFTTAAMGRTFYDEEGAHHRHDPNTTTTEYSCSRGHKWQERTRSACPSCAWPEHE
jgi:hypothetical protein